MYIHIGRVGASNLQACLKNHLQHCGMHSQDILLHLGKLSGDLLQVALEKLETPVDLLVAGPPCPPWSTLGSRECNKDVRAQVFWRILIWVFYLVQCGGLLAVCIENVVGTIQRQGGRQPCMQMFLQLCRVFIPQFAWRIDKLRLMDYKVPHNRCRVFLRGVRKIVCSSVPAPLAPWGQRMLRDVLGKHPPIQRKSLTHVQQANLRAYELEIRCKVANGKMQTSDVAVFAVDRTLPKDGGIYGATISKNYVPTLTCHNRYLFVASVGDVVARRADSEREFFRFLCGSERICLQGFRKELALDLDPSCQLKTSGNAYPVPLMVAVLQPVVAALASFDLSSWPSSDAIAAGLSAKQQVQQRQFERKLKRKPPLVPLQSARKLRRRS